MAKTRSGEALRKQKGQRQRADDLFTWRVLGVMGFLAVWTFFFFSFDWPAFLYALPSGLAVLYLLAYIYPRDFTALAVLVAGGVFGLWLLTMFYQSGGRRVMLGHLVFGAAAAAAALLIWAIKKKQGILGAGKLKLIIVPRKGRYIFLVIACVILVLALTAAIVFGRTAAIVSIIALLCYLFIAAVYYTVRLI
jgi:hypothetical protein